MASTAERILDSAQALTQTRGFNGFSYADISRELAITKPSVHHHFPTKAGLAVAMVARYRERFAEARRDHEDVATSPAARLLGYAGLYAEVFSDGGRMCLCGVLAADAASLPPEVRQATSAFFVDQEHWVSTTFVQAGLRPDAAGRAATAFLAALEGALLLSRADAPVSRPRSPARGRVPGVAQTLLDALLPR